MFGNSENKVLFNKDTQCAFPLQEINLLPFSHIVHSTFPVSVGAHWYSDQKKKKNKQVKKKVDDLMIHFALYTVSEVGDRNHKAAANLCIQLCHERKHASSF